LKRIIVFLENLWHELKAALEAYQQSGGGENPFDEKL